MKVVLLDNIYKRLESGTYFDEELKTYSQELIEGMLDLYEGKEDYEKCEFLKKLLIDRFSSHEDLYNPKKDMKTVIKELSDLSENAPEKLFSDLELFFCNCNLSKSQRRDLINILNKNIFTEDGGK